jgi:response regulator RpfG family c-di-GMP phosphodiesterase
MDNNKHFQRLVGSKERPEGMKYIDKIQDRKLKSAVQDAYRKYAYKLHFIPASVSGSYHPEDERGKEGLNIHVEKLCWFLDQVVQQYKLSDETRDILLTAAYFHDLGKVKLTRVKHVLVYKSKKEERCVRVERDVYGYDNHAEVSAQLAEQYLIKHGVPEEQRNVIASIIRKHMSHWTPHAPQPSTELEKLFALGDFIVSRKEFTLRKERKWLW